MSNKLWKVDIGSHYLFILAGNLKSAVKKAERVIRKEFDPRTEVKGLTFEGTIDAF